MNTLDLWSFFVGEYDKLWAAATGGRGTGRGRKKRIDTSAKPENLDFGMFPIIIVLDFQS